MSFQQTKRKSIILLSGSSSHTKSDHLPFQLWHRVQGILFPRPLATSKKRVLISLPAFPVMGGILTVLDGLDQVMKDRWQIEYLTQHVGPEHKRYVIHRFGTRRMTPWYFPFVWLYVFSGVGKIISLMRRGAGYQVFLPQDGIYSAAMAGVAGKLTGTRVICIDHGDLSLFTARNNRIYQAERIEAISTKAWPWVVRLLAKSLLAMYWPSRLLLAHLAARFVDHFLIPGVPGDSIEEGCKAIGIDPSRITRYGSMIDLRRHSVLNASSRAALRAQKALPVHGIVVAIVCRLSAEKGLDIALESISQALSALPPERRSVMRVVIGGDGPLRKQVEADIMRLGLGDTCCLWGELSSDEVVALLGISDIFLYTSTRGACLAMAVLEAMASGCAVIASTEPLSNAVLLAEGRGIAVSTSDREETSRALSQLFNDVQLCHQIGKCAREYVALHHSPELFRETLLRATSWPDLKECSGMGERTRLE